MNIQRVNYIDVGKMSYKEAYNVLNDLRKKNGLPTFLWIPVGVGLISLLNLLFVMLLVQ